MYAAHIPVTNYIGDRVSGLPAELQTQLKAPELQSLSGCQTGTWQTALELPPQTWPVMHLLPSLPASQLLWGSTAQIALCGAVPAAAS